MSFKRNVEDFVCEKCSEKVKGTGYTNHCPKCLWSKHVDIEPGDRAEECGGMMEPVRVEGTAGKFRLVHRCVCCTKEHRNNMADNDNVNAAILIARKAAD